MSLFKKAQQQIAHNTNIPALGNRELRELQDYITQEKDFVGANTKAATEFQKCAEAIKVWGDSEGEDLADVLGKLSILLTHYTAAQNRLNSHLATIRLYFKSIRTREESLSALKAQKARLGNKIEALEKKLAKMGPENKELMKTTAELKERRNEMAVMKEELKQEEAKIGDFKRRTTREAMTLKCAGLQELALKTKIVADFGKMLVAEVPMDTTMPGMPRAAYGGYPRTEQLLQEANRALSNVAVDPGLSANGPGDATFDTSRGYDADADPALGEYGAGDQTGLHSAAAAYGTQAPGTELVASGAPLDRSEVTSTPIYATHQTMRPTPWVGQQHNSALSLDQGLAPEGLDEAHAGAPGTSHASHDSAPVHGVPDVAPGFVTASEEAPGSRPGTRDGPPGLPAQTRHSMPSHDVADGVPPAGADGLAPASPTAASAPFLPPLRMSSPLPGGNAAMGSGARPMGVYEPAEGGRKMTAAAFRKGFNRNPSAQNLAGGGGGGGGGTPGSPMLSPRETSPPRGAAGSGVVYGGPLAPAGRPSAGLGAGEEAESGAAADDATNNNGALTAPLMIRKRLSSHGANHDVLHVQGASGDPAPPYQPGGGGGGGGSTTLGGHAESPPTVPNTSFLPPHLRIANPSPP